jgi:hypothetical protein
MTSQESDDSDASLLKKYREISSAQGLEPTESVRAAILAEGRRIAQQRAATPPLRDFDISQAAANHPRWRVAAFGTFGVAILAALLVVPRWLMPTASSPPVAKTESAAAPAEANAPSAPSSLPALPAPPELQGHMEARQIPAGKPAKRAADTFSTQNRSAAAPTVSTGGASAADSAAPPGSNSIDVSAARTARSAASAAASAAFSPATPLLAAVSARNLSQAGILLDQHAATEDRDGLGRTPLIIATIQGQVEMVRLLLDHGADPNAPDKSGATPLQQARRAQFSEIAQMLEQAGAH